MRKGWGLVVGKIVTLGEGETATALMMFAYSFLTMTSYNILKPITRSKYITALGADNLPSAPRYLATEHWVGYRFNPSAPIPAARRTREPCVCSSTP